MLSSVVWWCCDEGDFWIGLLVYVVDERFLLRRCRFEAMPHMTLRDPAWNVAAD